MVKIADVERLGVPHDAYLAFRRLLALLNCTLLPRFGHAGCYEAKYSVIWVEEAV